MSNIPESSPPPPFHHLPILTYYPRSIVEGYARFSPGTAKWNKHMMAEHVAIGGNGPIFVGTPSQVADGLEAWVTEADVDGFNFVSWFAHTLDYSLSPTPRIPKAYALFPQSFKDIAELLIPELRSRGLFWDDYAVPGGTYRENFYQKPGQTGPLDEHVASSYRWRANVPPEET